MKKLLIIAFLLLLALGMKTYAEAPTLVCGNHILVSSEVDAIKIRSQIKTFDDFKEYAKMYSQCPSGKNGGSLGCFERGQMVKPFEDAAFSIPLNEVSDPVKTQFGYHLLWITKKY